MEYLMMNVPAGIKALLAFVYWIAGIVVYFGTATVFFSEGQNFLGFLMLFLPPAGVILPWFAATWLGIVSVVGIAALVMASILDDH